MSDSNHILQDEFDFGDNAHLFEFLKLKYPFVCGEFLKFLNGHVNLIKEPDLYYFLDDIKTNIRTNPELLTTLIKNLAGDFDDD
jgi:hypothetical protein